jgi:hypothetical protein
VDNGFNYGTYVVFDTGDGSDNGITAVGDVLSINTTANEAVPSTARVVATTTNGVVVYNTDYSGYYLYTNASYAANASLIGYNTSDPFLYCFLSGTMIATPRGEVPVEYLNIGDEVTTADGRVVPIKWVGVQHLKNNMFTHHSKAPVCIAAGALGNGLPNADLYISADHGLIIDGLVVNAGALVNHTTIRFVPMAEMPAEFTYYHIETEAHDEILANGAPAETFIDYVGRKDFDNYQEYIDLYGCERIIPEMDRMRVSSQRQLPESFFERFNITHYDDQVAAELEKLEARLASDTEETDWDALLANPETRIVAKRNAA